MSYQAVCGLGLFFLLLLSLLMACAEPEVSAGMRAWAYRDNVTVIQGESSQPLISPEMMALAATDQISVDNLGRALLALSDSLVVELVRDGRLQVQEVTLDEETVLLTLAMNGGAVLNDLDVAEAIDARLQVQGDYATVIATGTRFLVVREQHTPLEWIVALESGATDLTVTADGATINLPAGKATWVAPDGPPGPIVDANMTAVSGWIEQVRDGNSQPEIGEVVWAPANLAVTAAEFPEALPTGDPFDVQQITVVLDPAGTYTREDCNGDGDLDLRVVNGRLQFDLRQIIGQKRAINVDIVNGDPGIDTILTGANPGREMIPDAIDAASLDAGSAETLRLRSDLQPFHFADLTLGDGCFVGIQLLPPEGGSGEVAATPTVTQTASPTPTGTATATATPSTTPTFTPFPACVPSPPYGWVLHTVTVNDTLFNLARRTGTTVAAIQQVNCWFSNIIYVGQQLWIPFHPPTVTPTPTMTPTPTDYPYLLTCTLTMSVVDVTPSGSATFRLENFPPNQTFTAAMGRMGTEGIDGIVVGTLDSGNGGTFDATFDIPYDLRTVSQIDVRLQAVHAQPTLCATTTFQNQPFERTEATPIPTATATATATSTPTATATGTAVVSPDFTVNVQSLTFGVSCPAGSGSCVTTVNFDVTNIGGGEFYGPLSLLVVADPDQSVAFANNDTFFELPPNSRQSITLTSPPGGNCFDPNCTVCVTVDNTNVVEEANERNNLTCRTFGG